ncbi:MAG: hypothetical protein IJS03_08635 [Eubacterium sp.]|nr:hypothetical protein [Eubacterium sp.]
MKSKHEIIAIALMLVICLIFAACSQKVEEKLTDKATQTSQTELINEEDNESTTAATTSTAKAEETTETTTLIKGAVITPDEALEQFNTFYGSLYKVELNEVKDKTANYTVYDKNDKEYAKISLNLKTGIATETITQTGEKNEMDMLA